jgi:hypothetical protein
MPEDFDTLASSLNETTPRQFIHLHQLYQAMVSESTDGVYEGKVVETFQRLNISMSYYTTLFNALKELGCIELIERGVRSRPTKYRLHGSPDEDAYAARYASDLTGGAIPATISLSELEQRISNMERRLQGLEIKQVVVNFESRLSALEKLQPEGGSK